MRIRTDGDYAWREAEIEALSDFYGRNETTSLLSAAEDVRGAADTLEPCSPGTTSRPLSASRYPKLSTAG